MQAKQTGAIRRLAGETAIYGMSTILARFINFLFVPLYTYMLSTRDFGILTEFMAYIALFQVVLLLGLETGCFRFANREDQRPDAVFSNAWMAVAAVSALFLGAMIAFGRPLSERMGYAGFYSCYVYIGLILALDATTAILFARLRYENRAWRFAVLKTVKVLTETGMNVLLFLVLPVWAEHRPDLFLFRLVSPEPDFTYPVFSILVSCVVVFLLLLPELFRLRLRLDRRVLRPMLVYSLPLMVAALPGIVNDFLDRILFRFFNVDQSLWQSDLGIYQAALKLAVIMSLFVQMFRYAAEPFFFARAKDKGSRELYARVMEYFVAFCILVFLGVSLYLDQIQLLLGRDFREGTGIVPLMLLSYMMLGMLFNVSMWYKLSNRSGYAVWITLTGLAVSTVINVIFLPRYSYVAAAWAHFFSYLVMLAVSVLLGNRYYPIPYRWGRILSVVGLGLGVYGISLCLPPLSPLAEFGAHTVLILMYLMLYYLIYVRKNKNCQRIVE